MSNTIAKTSDIRIKVGLNKNNIPVDIKWQATDGNNDELKDCKSIMISIWDPIQKDTLSIDLWTNDLRVDEMHSHFFQTLLNIANSYHQATGNPFIKEDFGTFLKALSQKTADWEAAKG